MTNTIIDLSHNQARVDFEKVKAAGIKAVILKATEGRHYVDPTYLERFEQAKAAGLIVGSYHFGTGSSYGYFQAADFLEVAKEGILVLDLEHNPGSSSDMTFEQAEDFLATVYQKTGKYPGLYGGNVIKAFLKKRPSPIFAKCWLWIAQYGRPTPELPDTWDHWTMWQFTQKGTVDGVSGPCDLDSFNDHLGDLEIFWKEHSIGVPSENA